MKNMMKAVVLESYGPPDRLRVRDIPKPVPGDHEVLVRVHAAAVNRTDSGLVRAKPFFMRIVTGLLRPKKAVSGSEFAGCVEATGPGVSRFSVGDRVFGFDDGGLGSHAEYLTIGEDAALATMPATASYEQAAGGLEGAHYAINFINKVKLEPGQNVLVNGATGAIGSAAVQLLKVHGIHVTAVCGTGHKDLVRSLGADEVIDYEKEDFTKVPGRFSFVFDTVGKSSFGRCRHLLEPGGTYISSELGYLAQNIPLSLITPLLRGRHVRFPTPVDLQGSVKRVVQLMEEGKFRPVFDRSYPLGEVVGAFRYVESGQKIGNVILQMGPS